MKVLLVRPRLLNFLTVSEAMNCEPLELEYLYTACRQVGVEARIYDGILETEKFSKRLISFQPDVVAITLYITQENVVKKYISVIRKWLPNCKVILGGVHAQLNFKRLYFDGVDFVTRSESMSVFQQLLISIRDHQSFDSISGLCYRTRSGFSENGFSPCDITQLPVPQRPCLKNDGRFRYLDFENVATLKTAVSCPYHCTFCYGTSLHGGIYQARPISKVIEEIETIPVNTVFIVDSDFLVDESRLRAFIAGIREKHIHKRFICYGRADFIVQHEELIGELCAVGFSYFLVGIEGIDDWNLCRYKKQTSKKMNEQCIAVLNRCEATCIALMIADLSFRIRDFRRLYQWVKSQPLAYVSLQILTPIPPTRYFLNSRNKLTETRPEKWDLIHPVQRPQNMPAWFFLFCHRFLSVKLFFLGRKRGAYCFVTFGYVIHALRSLFRRIGTVR
jgi:radical SAM superfamily enzyme YgiQ (UPF0313 family)